VDELIDVVGRAQIEAALPEMAETVGVSRSRVSREAVEASEEELKRLCERRFPEPAAWDRARHSRSQLPASEPDSGDSPARL
jgi:hypothetical protein